ncbi:MAG: hypothetical protein AAFN10_24100, partial [Bacteroidota bacterium]
CFPLSATEWSQPVNLGSVINSPGDDDAPRLSPDGKAIYFNSNGHGGNGDHDVFVSYRLDDSWRRWSEPENLGAPISSPGYDFDFMITQDGKEAYWASNFKSSGSNDIFKMAIGECKVDLYPEGNHTLCEGDMYVLEAGFAPGQDISYRWLVDGKEIPGATTRQLRVRASGDYQVVRIQGNCRATSPPKSIRFVPPPAADFSAPSDVLCLDDSLVLTADSPNATSYQWIKNGLDIPAAKADNYWVKTPGEYSVRVYRGECIQTSESLNLQRLTPPVIFSGGDTINGLLPVLPKWLWTNKVPYQKGDTYIRDLVANANGETFVLHTLAKRGRYYDQITGFFANGLYRTSFPEQQRNDLSHRLMAVDPNGNLVVGSEEDYLIKYYPDGRIMWRVEAEIPELNGVTTDPLGNIFTYGRFKEQLQIGKRVVAAPKRGGMFIAKHSPSGEVLWLKVYGVDGSKFPFGNAIHADCEGNIYLAGGMDLIANFKDQVVRASLRENSYFLAKFDTHGRLQWARRATTRKTRSQTLDVHTDCQGNSFLMLNRELFRYDAAGRELWTGKLLSPDDNYVNQARIHSSGGDLYVSGITNRGENFVTKLNRLNRQIILWEDKGGEVGPDYLPAIGGFEDEIFVSGLSKSNNFPGVQFDLTSKSNGFLMKYAPPSYVSEREPIEICKNEPVTLFVKERKGVRYQWFRNGKLLTGDTKHVLVTAMTGTYECQILTLACVQRSKPQQVIKCGDDPITSPQQTAPPITEVPDISANPEVPEPILNEPEPIILTDLDTDSKGRPQRLKNRRVKEQEIITINSTEATLYVWDHAAEDLDTVSINVNGQWILEGYQLVKAKKVLSLDLKPGNNYIMLYAHNLGTQPPNTATLLVDDGTRQKSLQLRSTLKNCGMLIVRVE